MTFKTRKVGLLPFFMAGAAACGNPTDIATLDPQPTSANENVAAIVAGDQAWIQVDSAAGVTTSPQRTLIWDAQGLRDPNTGQVVDTGGRSVATADIGKDGVILFTDTQSDLYEISQGSPPRRLLSEVRDVTVTGPGQFVVTRSNGAVEHHNSGTSQLIHQGGQRVSSESPETAWITTNQNELVFWQSGTVSPPLPGQHINVDVLNGRVLTLSPEGAIQELDFTTGTWTKLGQLVQGAATTSDLSIAGDGTVLVTEFGSLNESTELPSIEEFFASLGTPQEFVDEFSSEILAPGSSAIEFDPSGNPLFCSIDEIAISGPIREFIPGSSERNSVLPGTLYQSNFLQTGEFRSLTGVDLAPITVNFQGLLIPSVTAPLAELPSAINKRLNEALNQGLNPSMNLGLRFSSSASSTASQAEFGLGFDSDLFDFDFTLGGGGSQQVNTTRALLIGEAFEARPNQLNGPQDAFGPNQAQVVAQLEALKQSESISPLNLPVRVAGIGYGTIVSFEVTGTATTEQTQAALEAGIFGVNGSLGSEDESTLNSLSYKVNVLGGQPVDQAEIIRELSLGGLANYLEGITSVEDHRPIYIRLEYLDGTPFTVLLNDEITVKTCEPQQAFVVQDTADEPDRKRDGKCGSGQDGEGPCTLRGAFQEAAFNGTASDLILLQDKPYPLYRGGEAASLRPATRNLDVVEGTVEVQGAGEGNTVIRLQGGFNAFYVPPGRELVLRDLTLESISNTGRAVVVEGGTLRLENVEIKGFRRPENGGAIFGKNASLFLDNVVISDSEARQSRGGAIALNNGQLIANNVELIDNTAQQKGGAVYLLNAFASFTDSFIGFNETLGGQSRGGGIHAQDRSQVELINTRIEDNLSKEGGGVFLQRSGNKQPTLDIDPTSVIQDNLPDDIAP